LWYFRDTPTVQAIPGSRFLTISVTEQSFQTRFWTWNSAWEGFKERPILGWGPENFSAVFDRHFDIRHYTPGKSSETWFDRAHSVIFDYLTETGILGLLAYIAMFVVFYLQFFRATSKKLLTNEKTGFHISPVSLGLFGTILIGYLVQGLVLFDVLPIYMNLFLVLAFAVYLFNHAFPSHESKS
jgi:O-antigen ligase